jgi:hypothetical protein
MMGMVRRARSISGLLLLVAVAIQGITPDPHDLASLNALRLLFPDITEPCSADGNDESPNDVCGSVQLEMHLAIRKRTDLRALPFIGFLTTAHSIPLTAHATHLLPSALVPNARLGDLIHSLCRLNC